MDELLETNRRHWDELVALHQKSAYYDVPGFKAGNQSLHPLEVEELGDVSGKRLLHLQCHFGLDTLSWARRGAIVTGVDFSPAAVDAARELASETGLDAAFVCSGIDDLPGKLDGEFDIVYTSYGAVFWLPDVRRWAEVIAHFLRPGGAFYIVEFHPMAGVFEVSGDELTVRYPYFPGEALRFDEDGTYADREAALRNKTTYTWAHPVSEVVSALIEAGLRIEFLHEFPYSVEQWFPIAVQGDDGYWRLPDNSDSIPLMYSLRATKP